MKKTSKETIWDMAMQNASSVVDTEGTEKESQPVKHKSASHSEKINVPRELWLLLSNRQGLFSSKKFERLIVFFTFLILSVIYISIKMHDMETLDFIEITGVWLAYGGYNSYMSHRDKKLDQATEEISPS